MDEFRKRMKETKSKIKVFLMAAFEIDEAEFRSFRISCDK
jgi:hypothetical protein